MKKVAFIVVVVAVVVYLFGFLIPNLQEQRDANDAQANASATPADMTDDKGQGGPDMRGRGPGAPGGPGMGGQRGMRISLEELKNEEGFVEIAKLDEMQIPENFKTELKESLTEADANADGLLDEEEQQTYQDNRRAKMIDRMIDALKNEEGQFALSTLEKNDAPFSPQLQEFAKQADADADGLLNEDELQVAKDLLTESLKKFSQRKNEPGMRGRGPGAPDERPARAPNE